VSDAATTPTAAETSGEPAVTQPVPSGQVPTNMRRGHTARDMFWALAVLLVPILLIGGLLKACGSQDATVVDPAPAIADARAANLFEVVAPQGLSDGWRVVQANFRRAEGGVGTLRLGYLTPSGEGVQVVESNGPAADLLTQELGDQVRPQGETTVAGRPWTSSIVRGNERALVDTTTARTLIVVGQASFDDLTTLAASLR
jgi:hypothetical protein